MEALAGLSVSFRAGAQGEAGYSEPVSRTELSRFKIVLFCQGELFSVKQISCGLKLFFLMLPALLVIQIRDQLLEC